MKLLMLACSPLTLLVALSAARAAPPTKLNCSGNIPGTFHTLYFSRYEVDASRILNVRKDLPDPDLDPSEHLVSFDIVHTLVDDAEQTLTLLNPQNGSQASITYGPSSGHFEGSVFGKTLSIFLSCDNEDGP